jgi:hypothetical protein
MAQMPKAIQEMLRDADIVRRKKNIVQQMMTERTQFEGTWKQLSRYINPMRGRFDEDKMQDGRRRDYCLLDPYPMEASGKCAAGLHSGLTSPSRPWFALGLQDKELAEYHTVKLWLEECQDVLMGIYAKSNIYNMLLNIEAELTQFGTAAALLLEDFNTGVWARPYTCGEYAGNVDARGRVVQFARRFKLNAWQMVDEFGEDVVSDAVRHAYRAKNLKDYFPVTMLIEKNADYRPDSNALLNFKYKSYYFEDTQTDVFLKVSGYHEVPFLMPRWTVVANGIYGVGPGHNALGNCMQLQKIEKINCRLLEHRSDPALIVPSSVGKVNRLPGKETLVPDNLINGIRPLYEATGDRGEVMQTIQYKQQQIGAAFYNDLFVMLAQQDNPQMTAREVAERHEEKLLMLSPVLEQMHNEVLAPLTRRAFEICYRNGLLPPLPEELRGQEESIKAEFISLLAQAQKAVGTNAMEKTLAIAGNLMGASPDVMDNLDLDAAIRAHAQMSGTPETIMRDEQEVQKMREQRAQQMQQEQQMQQAAAMAKPLKDSVEAARLLSETPINENTIGNILGGG